MIPNPFSVLYASTKSFLSGEAAALTYGYRWPCPWRPSRLQLAALARPEEMHSGTTRQRLQPSCLPPQLPAGRTSPPERRLPFSGHPPSHASPRPCAAQPLAPPWLLRCGPTASTCLSSTPLQWRLASTTRRAQSTIFFCQFLPASPTSSAPPAPLAPAGGLSPPAPPPPPQNPGPPPHHPPPPRHTSWTPWSSSRSLRCSRTNCPTLVGGRAAGPPVRGRLCGAKCGGRVELCRSGRDCAV